jgi:acetylornithine deacetylase
MTQAAIRHLREYVAIPSVNPMGRDDLPADIVGEHRYAAHLREQLRALAVDAEVIGSGGRCSVVAEVAAAGPARETVMVASHLDTVPVDGMEIDPFDPKLIGGRLHGRGSCDTKAGMAALVAALEHVLPRGTLRRNLIVVGEADEELHSVGVRDVLRHLGSRRPDWVLATEPTEMRVVHRHKGVVHIRLVASGHACHASEPELGRNAIVWLSRAAVALDELADTLARRADPDLGPPTLSIGLMRGGHAPNIVPDHAELVADRRLLPGESLDQVRTQVEDALARHALQEAVHIAACTLEKPTLGTPADHPAVVDCLHALDSVGQEALRASVAFGTDAGVFEVESVPGVVIGPGSIQRAHTSAEYVEVDQVEAMTDFFVALLSGD